MALADAIAAGENSAPGSSIEGRSVPSCSLTLAGTGQSVSLDQYRGKVLYLDFWASWCTPCLLSFPFMNQLQRSSPGVQVLAVNMDEKPADARAFLAAHPAVFSVANGPNAKCAKDLGVATMPTSFLIDRSGIVRSIHAGFRPGDAALLRAKVEELLSAKPKTN